MSIDFNSLGTAIGNAIAPLTNSIWNILGALVVLIVGNWAISWLKGLIKDHIGKQKNIDETLSKYIVTSSDIVLKILLIIACMGLLGIQTTTFAALLGAAGVAIGMAWSGLLSNFAAGAFLLFLRPFKVGDTISVNGVTGTVVEIGVFSTSIDTLDKIRTVVGNNAVLTNTIQNFSSNDVRRVDITFQAPAGTDIDQLTKDLKAEVLKCEGVIDSPAPECTITEFKPMGPMMQLRPYCKASDYWKVYHNTSYMLCKKLPEFEKLAAVVAQATNK